MHLKTNKSNVFKKLEHNVKKALSFVETFGVVPKELLCETFDGESCSIKVEGSKSKYTGSNNLSVTEQRRVKRIFQVCDNSMISNSAYHELAMHCDTMPRKCNLIECRNEINSQLEVMRTPGLLPGSYLSFKTEINNHVQKCKDKPKKLKIKISGDGAKVSRISNFIVVSWSIIEDEQCVSHLHQRVLATVKCEENYTNLEKKNIRTIFQEINDINKDGYTCICSERIDIQLFIGGDMKFIQLILGINSSIATYACSWCTVNKEDRGNVALPWDFYHSEKFFRSISEIKNLARSSSKTYGVKAAPLLNVEPHHYIPDELHLLMRIIDVLLPKLIFDTSSKDDYGKIIRNNIQYEFVFLKYAVLDLLDMIERLMETVLADLHSQICLIYLDCVIV